MSRNNAPKNRIGCMIVMILLIVAMIAGTAFMIKLCLDVVNQAPPVRNPSSNVTILPTAGTEPTETEAPTETTMPEPEHVVATATIGAMGDLLMHKTVFDDSQYNSAVQKADGTYDFEPVFRYLKDYVTPLDYAAINLETTLASNDNGYAYSGYPNFNCPDEIVDGVMDSGFDMLLTANNHSYDTTMVGYKRTLEVAREAGMETLGTYLSADETKWTIVDINGIQVGMLCYTWANYDTEDGRPSLNGNAPIAEAGLCNYFVTKEDPSTFYSEVEGYLQEMEEAGADATVMYIHWGVEYLLSPNDEQKKLAQGLCDLGIDVIVGGHPHVVQPVALLESTTDPDHKTVCIYSTGNAVSNQRLGNLDSIKTAHTEDGILFTVTFERYSDGTVYLAGTDAIPTWVNMHNNSNGKTEYTILPLDYSRVEEWKDMFDLGDNTLNAAKKSYDRTWALVGEGLAASQEYLDQQKQEREQYYYDLVFNPDKLLTEATEAPAETETTTAATE